jgi:hypothetical protein
MPKRILLVSIFSLVVIGATLMASTQYVASQLGYHRHLGAPAGRLAGVPVYRPWAWLEWEERMRRFAPRVFATASLVTYGAMAGVLVPIVALAFLRGGGARGSTSHGSARWASTAELRDGGMLGGKASSCARPTGRASNLGSTTGAACGGPCGARGAWSGMTVPSMCSSSPRPDRAKGSGSSCPPFSAGARRRSSTTSRRSSGASPPAIAGSSRTAGGSSRPLPIRSGSTRCSRSGWS